VKKLFLLDGMALVYRAHFALIGRPIFNSKGVNTSALYGFTQTLLEILRNQQPTHIAVAFDTDAPTHRHTEFADYKATREAMPEELSQALPHVRRMLQAFNIPVLICDGFEADDIIGTLVRRAEKEGFQSYMVTPDKDFGQLVDENTFLYKPSRMGDAVEVLGLAEIQKRWAIVRPEQVVDILALMGDSTDNIPGVPGVGEKTAIKLIGQFDTVENLLNHIPELTGRVKDSLEKNREQALLSKRLATIICDAPCVIDLETLKLQALNEEEVKALFIEFEFNSIGRRLFGEDFKAGRGGGPSEAPKHPESKPEPVEGRTGSLALNSEDNGALHEEKPAAVAPNLKTAAQIGHEYHTVTTPAERADLIHRLQKCSSFAFNTQTTGASAKDARLFGLAFSFAPHAGYYVPLPQEESQAWKIIDEFRLVLESAGIEKTGHNLKFDVTVLKWQGITVRGRLFDTMVAHSLLEPDMRHSLNYLAEVYLAYSPIPIARLTGEEKSEQLNLGDVPLDKMAEHAVEKADVALQLRAALEPLLKTRGQERVFYEIESPLLPVLVDMEYEGIKVDAAALADFANQLGKEIDHQEKAICQLARSFSK
jgi:DNA polymerase-1